MNIFIRLKRAAKELLGRRQWPRPEAPKPVSYEDQIYAALIRNGDVCFDIGANRGDVALFMAKIAGKSGLVVAFEPVWSTYLSLCSNLQFDLVEKAPIITVPAGLADTEKKSTINVPEGKFAMGSMADANAWAEAQLGASVKSYCVSFTTIDIFRSAATNIPPPEFIKIDVEGAELFVLRGAEKLFSDGRRPLMLIELFAPWQKALGYGPWDVLSWLLDRDYRILFACPSGLVYHMPTSSRPFPPEYEAGYNIIAYHPKSHQARIDLVQHVFSSAATKIFPMTPPPQLNRLN